MNKPIVINRAPSRHFIHVSPLPVGKTMEQLLSNPIRNFIINKTPIKAHLHDVLIYPLDFLSEYHCRLALGFTTEQMQQYIKAKFPSIKSKAKIAFYLLEKI